MPTDYAKQARTRRVKDTKRKPAVARRPPSGKQKSAPKPAFSGTSFLVGVGVGVTAVVLIVFAPGWISSQEAAEPAALEPSDAMQTVQAPRFEFWDRLPASTVLSNTAPYRSGPTVSKDEAREYLLQAGSFKQHGEAESLRAALLLDGFNAHTTEVALGHDGTWYRVLVGPFATKVETQRAMTRLREQSISAILLKSMPTAG